MATWSLLLVLTLPGAELPEHLKRLERSGNVAYAFYDPAIEPRERPAQADFHFDIQREYSFRYRLAGSEGQRNRVIVVVTIQRSEVRLSHMIHLPRGWEPTDPALRKLMAHEYDHVAISTDPRARRLLERLLNRGWTAEIQVNEISQDLLEERVERLHQEDLRRSLDAVVAFIHAHNARLDALTDHGARPLPERDAFFATLYDPEPLRRAGFPDDVVTEETSFPANPDLERP